jgi:hypothetical protein
MKNLIYFLCLGLLACDRSDPLDTRNFNVQGFLDCQNQVQWNPNAIKSVLQGDWVWISANCNNTFNPTANRGLVLRFSGNQVSAIFNNRVLNTSTFRLEADQNLFKLVTTPAMEEAKGLVLICLDEMVLYNPEPGDCHHYFEER